MTPDQIHTLRRKLKFSPEEFASAHGFTGKDRRSTVVALGKWKAEAV